MPNFATGYTDWRKTLLKASAGAGYMAEALAMKATARIRDIGFHRQVIPGTVNGGRQN